MDHKNPTFAKISILDTGKFEQWKFRIQQYLQNEHYALREVIEFGDSYKVPLEETGKGPASESSAKKKGRTVVITTEDMPKRRNDVKARTTLLLALPGEHQLRFSKYETAKELWEAILKTFGENEATKKTKKNQLKLQYGNFKAEGSETLEQTFNRLQALVSHLEFMDDEIEQDDLNQKFLISLAPEWLINEKSKVSTASVPTASTQVFTANTDVAVASLSHDTICAYIATQSNGSQIKYEDITQIDKYDIEEMDIKWNMALLSLRADRFWKKTGKTITIQGSDIAGFEKSKVECFNCHKMGHFARECRAPRSQDIGKRESYKQANDKVPTEFAFMAKSSSSLDNEKDLSWTGLPEFVDDTVTDYNRPTPSIDASKCNKSDLQSSNVSVFEHGESSGSIMSKPIIKFVKEADCPRVIKINNTENARKSTVKYAKIQVNTDRPKAVINAVRMNQVNDVKASEVIEFGDSYKVLPEETGKGPASESSTKKKGMIVVITTEDMQKRKNDVKARTTLLLALPNEHQLRFSKYETAKELWEAILKTFGGNEATKKIKKNQLKLQYDTMSLDDVYNHLKVYEPEVQKKLESNSQNMAFISSSNTSSEKGKVSTASVPTASTQVSTANTDVAAASLSHDTICAFWKKTGKKIIIQGSDVASFDKSKVECFNCQKMVHFARECRAPRSQDRRKRESYKQGPKEEEPAPKALMAIDDIGWDWSYMSNEEENHALVADDEVPTEFAPMAKSISSSDNERSSIGGYSRKIIVDPITDKNKEGLGYNAVPHPLTQIYSPPKKDLSWTGLLEFVDDTITDYSRPTPSIDASKCNKSDLQSSNFYVFEHGESSGCIMSKPNVKFVKEADCLRVIKINNTKNARKSTVKYVEMYRNISKGPKVRGN
nr:hypothetical protein [Tanacetum cinerariifolium]